MDIGFVGGVTGGILGLAGGIFGTYLSLRNTKGPLERAFMIKSAVTCWVFVLAFVALVLILPRPYNFLLFIPYGIVLIAAIAKCNVRLAALRAQEDNGEAEDDSHRS